MKVARVEKVTAQARARRTDERRRGSP